MRVKKSIDECISRMSEAISMNDASLYTLVHTRLRSLPMPRVKVRSLSRNSNSHSSSPERSKSNQLSLYRDPTFILKNTQLRSIYTFGASIFYTRNFCLRGLVLSIPRIDYSIRYKPPYPPRFPLPSRNIMDTSKGLQRPN